MHQTSRNTGSISYSWLLEGVFQPTFTSSDLTTRAEGFPVYTNTQTARSIRVHVPACTVICAYKMLLSIQVELGKYRHRYLEPKWDLNHRIVCRDCKGFGKTNYRLQTSKAYRLWRHSCLAKWQSVRAFCSEIIPMKASHLSIEQYGRLELAAHRPEDSRAGSTNVLHPGHLLEKIHRTVWHCRARGSYNWRTPECNQSPGRRREFQAPVHLRWRRRYYMCNWTSRSEKHKLSQRIPNSLCLV